MKVVNGWTCPDLLSSPGGYQSRFDKERHVFEAVKSRRSCVQAGGHVGTYPIGLAALFGAVYTFEPDAENFTALTANIQMFGLAHVFPARGLLGHKRGPRGLHLSTKSTGQHRVKGDGLLPVYRIDDLGLTDCDLIQLDVEGFEINALRGAEETLKACRPLVVAEENRRARDHGFKIGELEILMRMFNYKLTGKIGEDLIFQHRKAAA